MSDIVLQVNATASGNLTLESIFSEELLFEIAAKLISIGIILLATFIISWIIGTLLDRMFTIALPQYRRQFHKYVQWLVWALGFVLSLSVLGLDVNLFLIIITLLGIGILLSSQELLRNFAAKAALDINPPYKVGDTIEVQGHVGRVVQTNYLSTVLLDEHGKLAHIPNSAFIRNPTTNYSTEGGSRVDVLITLKQKKDLKVLDNKLEGLQKHLKGLLVEDHAPRVEVRRITDDKIEVAVLLRVLNPQKCSSVESEANRYFIENL